MTAVLFVTRKFPPAVGGMETLASDVWATLDGEPGLEPELVALGGSQKWLPIFLLRSLAAMRRFSRRHPDGVVLTGDVLMFLLLLPATSLLRVRLITMAMGKDVVWDVPGYRRLVRRLLRRARAVLAISAATERAVRDMGVPADRARLIPLGVQIPVAERAPADRTALLDRFGFAGDVTVALTLGRLVRRKGAAWFIREVLPGLPATIRYLVAGTGDDIAAVRAAIQTLDAPERVCVVGGVTDEERELLMRGCDLFLQPNIPVAGDMEGFGLVAVEAGVRGALVVAADLEGLRDAVIPDQTGLLVTAQDADEWRRVLTPLINDPREAAEQARRFAARSRQLYSRERMGSMLGEVIRTVPVG